MTGTVTHINKPKKMYSILLFSGEYTVIETQEELELGDKIAGSLQDSGLITLKKKETGKLFSAIIQNSGCTEPSAKEQCFL
ncbi:MAG TPA: hypothetical protein VK484_08365 [Ferruginibacter sp.]|nr:hypothetical protein [Ferruginibacter sp.]